MPSRTQLVLWHEPDGSLWVARMGMIGGMGGDVKITLIVGFSCSSKRTSSASDISVPPFRAYALQAAPDVVSASRQKRKSVLNVPAPPSMKRVENTLGSG